MKVTINRLKLRAAWEVIMNLHVILKLAYLRFYNPMVEAYTKNPNMKWK